MWRQHLDAVVMRAESAVAILTRELCDRRIDLWHTQCSIVSGHSALDQALGRGALCEPWALTRCDALLDGATTNSVRAASTGADESDCKRYLSPVKS